MIVWCRLCETNTVDVLPDDALHESFTGELCETCLYANYPQRILFGVDPVELLRMVPGNPWALPDIEQSTGPWKVAVEVNGKLHLHTFNHVSIHGNEYTYSYVPE